ncbi:MAG: CAP domain-containing protein [Cyanobacteria bacterium P01_G01_bin.38]
MKLTTCAVFLGLGLALTGCGGGGGGSDAGGGNSANADAAATPSVLSVAAECATQYSSFVTDLLTLTNAARDEAGVDPLTFSYQLGQSAQTYAKEMADNDFFSHTGLNNSTFGQRIAGADYQFNAIGENLGAGFSTPSGVVNGWLASEGHRNNILNEDFTDIGLGVFHKADSTHGTYWVQHFGKPSASASSNSERFTPTTCSLPPQASADQVLVKGAFATVEDSLPSLTGTLSPPLARTPTPTDTAPQSDAESVPEPGAIAGILLLTASLYKRRH